MEAWYNHTGEENGELVMLTKKKALRIIQESEEEIKACGVEEIGIFGSFVKSAQRSRSDIDILVEFEDGQKTFDNYMELKFLLQKLLSHKVDLVIRDALKPRIMPYVIREVEYARL